MKTYYECHITMVGDPAVLRPLVEELGWTFSAIDGDPNLGPGVKCYATKQLNTRWGEDRVIDKTNFIAGHLRRKGADVRRRKVELVVYDYREPQPKEEAMK